MPAPTQLTALAIAEPAAARRRVLGALDETQGHRARAAELLGVPLRTLHRVLARLGISAPHAPRPRTGLSPADAAAAVAEHGSISAAAKALGCHATTVWRRCPRVRS